MLRNKPRLKYCGLTIIMSNPSRFDTMRLLTANGGTMIDNFCLRPEINSMMCDIRLMEDTSPLLPDTKAILLLGESAMQKYVPQTLHNTLNEMRGTLFSYMGIPTIASYNPQDAVDTFKNYEAENNKFSKDYTPDDSVSGDDEEEGDVKRHGRTKRANYSFWLRADCKKIKLLLSGFKPTHTPPTYRIYPSSDEVINILSTTKGQHLYFDTETDCEDQNLQCFAFSFDGNTIYSVPVLDYTYHPAYSAYYFILKALAIAIRDNTVVAHNGANFDFFVLAHKYHIPIVKTYDTMIAMHRCFPDVDKSLGHCVSYWTWEPFHKDEGSVSYRSKEQMMDQLKYCGKDVYTMYLVKQAIDAYAKTIPGLEKSISDAMACIRPYLIATLQGIKVNEQLVNKMVNENDRLMVQYNRMIELLIGQDGMRQIRSVLRSKPGMFAGSNTQCCEYFHNLMGYPVILRSKETNKPALGKKSLYKMALAHDNPVITMICMYRQIKKETGRLRFLPWVP
jgi:hypothetical protein